MVCVIWTESPKNSRDAALGPFRGGGGGGGWLRDVCVHREAVFTDICDEEKCRGGADRRCEGVPEEHKN